jgi:hypothetical protein
LTTQSFARSFEATKEQIAEAEQLMKGLYFKESYDCCDGYESWTSTRNNIDAFVELISRARATNH